MQAALRAFTLKVPWVEMGNPTLYSLLRAHPVALPDQQQYE